MDASSPSKKKTSHQRTVCWEEHVNKKIHSAPLPAERMLYLQLKRQALWEQNERVCAYLESKGEHVRRPDRNLTFVDDETGESHIIPGLSKSQILPVNFDAKAREMHIHFQYFSTHEHTGSQRTVIVTSGRRCRVQELRSRYQSLIRLVQQGFEDARRRFPELRVQPLSGRFEYTVREEDDGTLSYHPHLHCIFSVGNISATEQEEISTWLQKRLKTENVDEPVQSNEALSRYLSKEQDLDLLIAKDELHELFNQLQGCTLFRTYGPFRKWLGTFRKSGKKIETFLEAQENGSVIRRYYLRRKRRSMSKLDGVPAKGPKRGNRKNLENVFLTKLTALRRDGTYGVATAFLNATVDPKRIYDVAEVERWIRDAA